MSLVSHKVIQVAVVNVELNFFLNIFKIPKNVTPDYLKKGAFNFQNFTFAAMMK